MVVPPDQSQDKIQPHPLMWVASLLNFNSSNNNPRKLKSLLLCSLPSSLSVLVHNECRSHIYALAEKAYSSLIATLLNQAGFHHQRRKWCRQDREHEGYLQGPGEPQERALQRPANVNMILEAFRQCFLLFHNSSCFVRTSFPALSLFFFVPSSLSH